MNKETGMPMAEPIVDADADGIEAELRLIKERILHALEVFPFLSRSMIHQAIGTGTSTRLWQPILERLCNEGVILRTEIGAKTPLNRLQTYTLYHLPERTYTPSTNNITATPVAVQSVD